MSDPLHYLTTQSERKTGGALSSQMMAFADGLILGGLSVANAADAAGYAHDTGPQVWYTLRKNPSFVSYLVSLVPDALALGAVLGLGRMHELVGSRDEEVALRAAGQLMDRGGLVKQKPEPKRKAGGIEVKIDIG